MRGVYAILNEECDPIELARVVLEGGVRIVQYRAKNGIVSEHISQLRTLTHAYDALFLINDDWRAAKSFDADGVHLGPQDVSADDLPQIRRALGDRIIGLSCGTVEEARTAQSAGVDYIGVGSVYATKSKNDAGEPLGIEGLRRIAAATMLPVAAIGGIDASNLRDVRAAGVAMAAMISAFSLAENPREAAMRLVKMWGTA